MDSGLPGLPSREKQWVPNLCLFKNGKKKGWRMRLILKSQLDMHTELGSYAWGEKSMNTANEVDWLTLF